MQIFSSLTSFLGGNAQVIILAGLAYLLFAGIFYLVFYVWENKKYWYAKIQQRYPESKHIIRDLKYSAATVVVFGSVTFLVSLAIKHGFTLVYKPIDKYGYSWFFFSIVLMVIMHDAYFYWTHRLLHWKPLFKWVHKAHHLSHNPTPFSAYAFHPVEALINVGIVPLVAFTIPSHVLAITLFTTYQLFVNVLGHLGFELLPKGFARHKVTKWHNTFTHHNLHHQFVKCNYGLYLNFWDRIMKTNHPHYEEHFDKVAERRKKNKIVLNGAVEEQGHSVGTKEMLNPKGII